MNQLEYRERLYDSELYHWGILGMKWGVRRYQNEDGSLTPAGRKRYLNSDGSKKETSQYARIKKVRDEMAYRSLAQDRTRTLLELENKGKRYKKGIDWDKYDENTKSEAIKNGIKAQLNTTNDIASADDATDIYDNTKKLASQGFVQNSKNDGSYTGYMKRTNDDGSVDDVAVGYVSNKDWKMHANGTKDLSSVVAEKEKVVKSKEYKQALEDFISNLKSNDDYESDKGYYQEIERAARKAAAHPDMTIDSDGAMNFSLDNQFYMYRDPQTKKLQVMYFD